MRNLIFILSGPIAIFFYVSAQLLLNTAMLYHQPWGIYVFAAIPTLILSFMFWIMYAFITEVPKVEADLSLFELSFAFHIVGFLLYSYLETHFMLSLPSVVLIGFGLILALKKYRNSLILIENKLHPFSMRTAAGVAVTIPLSLMMFVRIFIEEPKTPFELRNEILQCSVNTECTNFNCKGYNMGMWYCDSDGVPVCRSNHCSCSIGCI